ncbi:MAG: glycine cleavage system aminomethyltransferase GcvT [Proteobacteria bacterium]|nr:glycine cleavage system aminomethyltransferase GcvT [Pseudomonadota bacterium]
MDQLKTTPLITAHREAGARLVPFAGHLMPLQYRGIVAEHLAVRQAVGLFDVSHMGELVLRGPGALATIERLATNTISDAADGQAVYTPLCNPLGGVIDDCVVYRQRADHLMVVVNAANVQKDADWFRAHASADCSVEDESEQWALLALQGPRALATWSALAGPALSALPRFRLAAAQAAGASCIAARTGYTGEDGLELFCSADAAPRLWAALHEAGAAHDLQPCGLGARDTLRLEARLLLYGQDLDETTTPLEAGLGWTVKLAQKDFIGRAPLLEQQRQGLKRRLVGLTMRSRGIARAGYPVHDGSGETALGARIGAVTSGTMSPSLKTAIALAYVPTTHAAPGQRLQVESRGKAIVAEVVRGPFLRAGARSSAGAHQP